MKSINIYITEYVDGTYELEPKHMHYAFRDDLNYDNVKPEDLGSVMRKITRILPEAKFIMV